MIDQGAIFEGVFWPPASKPRKQRKEIKEVYVNPKSKIPR
jgi:hypothetical protein